MAAACCCTFAAPTAQFVLTCSEEPDERTIPFQKQISIHDKRVFVSPSVCVIYVYICTYIWVVVGTLAHYYTKSNP